MFRNDYMNLDHIRHLLLSTSNTSEFQKCTTHAQRVNLYLTEEWRLFYHNLNKTCYKKGKNDEKSVEIREAGNLQFRGKKYLDALQTYTSSIAWAKSKATASLAYGNRSAVLAKFGLYEECLIDIERAFKLEYPEKSKPKLLHRQREVRELLLQKNGKKITKTEIGLEERNSLIQSATNSVKIANNEKYGRHIVAAKNIKIGELLVVEEPYTVGLFKDLLLRCHQCAARCYNLIPCDSCTETVYCTETCKQEAYQNYHKYECLILDYVREYAPSWKINLKTTLIAKIKSETEEKNSIYRSDRFYEISQLLIHPDKYPSHVMLEWYFTTAQIFLLLKEKTTLFHDFDGFEETFKESFVVNLLRWKPNGMPVYKIEVDGELMRREIYACGLYSFTSLFNHSCYPNAFYYYEGSKVIIRALASIRKEILCLLFTTGPAYHKMSKSLRTEELQNKFFFTCECKACEENWPPIGELFENFTCVSDAHCIQNEFCLKRTSQILAGVENVAPLAEINFLRRDLENQYSPREILPQAL